MKLTHRFESDAILSEKFTAATLLLEDGTEYVGNSFGANGLAFGEIVFSTGMIGYLETVTDPSYFGQIVVQTFPEIGNYGINEMDKEGVRPWVSGYVVRNCCEHPTNFRCEMDLKFWLKKYGVVCIDGVDTRSLTRRIREYGVMNAAILTGRICSYSVKNDLLKRIKNFKIKDAVKRVSITKNKKFSKIEKYRSSKMESLVVCIIDYGVKKSIVKHLEKRGAKVIVLPYDVKAGDILKFNPNGIILSNGPGNPAENIELIENLKGIQNLNIPIFGICLGHQLLALANGAKAKKLKYGHRGLNQPVMDLESGKVLITSQNHGYCVCIDEMHNDLAYISHYNVNDKTCEGIIYKSIPAFTVQFHPEASAGPLDAEYLFDRFFSIINENCSSL